MKHISWIVTLPLMLALVIFSLANRARRERSIFWPFKLRASTLPLFLPLLGALFVGLLIGGSAAVAVRHQESGGAPANCGSTRPTSNAR